MKYSNIPEIHVLTFFHFQCLTLSNKYKRGKLLAYQLLCQMMVRHPDLCIPQDLLTKFYHVLHQGLTSNDQVSNMWPGSKSRTILLVQFVKSDNIFIRSVYRSLQLHCVKLRLAKRA